MTYELACLFRAETDAACLVVDPASGEEIWLPLSQVERIGRQDHRGKFFGEGIVTMPDWLARKKGLL